MKKRLLSLMMVFAILYSFATPVYASASSAYGCASSLYTLGLFKGTGTNSDGTPIFSLDRAPTRAEAAVMLVRMIGKENEAKKGSYNHPFRDVEEWARPYVAFVYSKGLSNGTSDTTYGSEDTISAPQFITLVLRALGYSSGKDFNWDTSYQFSDSIGLTDGSYSSGSPFTRGDTAIIMFSALSQKTKGTSTTLLASLYNNGVISLEAINSVGLSSLISGGAELTPSQVYAKCSPAVFFIEIYDASGDALGFGSGFFIDSNGTAVTNYHVIEDAKSAAIKTTDGKVSKVLGVYSTDPVNDLAILKIEGSGFPYLETADSDAVKTGATVYAIGNPEGLESTISQGLISYTNRSVNGVSYLQTTAAISSGSSGGALIDAYGKVVGVTAATLTEGQNLNLAVPINRIKNMARTNYTALSSGSAVTSTGTKGTEKAYTGIASVPDFGAYFGISPYNSSKNVGTSSITYNFHYKATDVSAVDTNALNNYVALLKKWGFSYARKYSSSSSTLAGNIYTNSDNSVEVLVATQTSSSGTKFVTIGVDVSNTSSGSSASSGSGSYPKTETAYSASSKVPDLGKYFGVSPAYTDSGSDSGGSSYIYYYNLSDLNKVDTNAYSDYIMLLNKWGFKYVKAYTSKDGKSVGGMYQNGNVYVILANDNFDSGKSVSVFIYIPAASGSSSKTEKGYSYNSSVPDLGAYFGVSLYKKMSSDNVVILLYNLDDVYKADPKAVTNYISLLKKWGFSYNKSVNETYLLGDYYVNGKNSVYFGLYKYQGTTYLTVAMNT